MRKLLVCLALLPACGGGDDDGWQGETPHVDIHGTLGDTDIALDLDEDAAANLERVFCKREYVAEVFPEIEATVRVVEDGIEKEFEIGFTAADFGAIDAPATREVVPAVEDVAPAAGQVYLEMEWTWEDPAAGFVNWEGAATSGTVSLERFAPDRATADSALGLYFDATWAEGSVAGSLTIHCGPDEIE